jgi:hypothetical protein
LKPWKFQISAWCYPHLQALFVLAVVFCYFGLFVPTIKRLDVVLKTARATLLQFPDEVITGVPAVRHILKDLSKNAKSG